MKQHAWHSWIYWGELDEDGSVMEGDWKRQGNQGTFNYQTGTRVHAPTPISTDPMCVPIQINNERLEYTRLDVRPSVSESRLRLVG